MRKSRELGLEEVTAVEAKRMMAQPGSTPPVGEERALAGK
jgi:hypothetical protein